MLDGVAPFVGARQRGAGPLSQLRVIAKESRLFAGLRELPLAGYVAIAFNG